MTKRTYVRLWNIGLRLFIVVVVYGIPIAFFYAPGTFTVALFLILCGLSFGNLAADIYMQFRVDPADESYRTPEHE